MPSLHGRLRHFPGAIVDLTDPRITRPSRWAATTSSCSSGVTDDALVRSGDAVLPAEVDGSFAVVVEHGQVVDAVDAHPEHISHRKRGVTAGARRRRHRDVRIGD